MNDEVSKIDQSVAKGSKNGWEPFKPMGVIGKFFAGVILLIIVIIAYYYLSYQWDMYVEKGKMLEYLEERYGKKFVVEDVHTTWRGLGVPTLVSATAYAVDNKDLTFGISKYDVDIKAKYYSDGYLAQLWDRQAQQMVREYFDAHDIDIPKFYIGITFLPTNEYGKIKGTPELKETLIKYGKNVQFSIALGENGQFNDETKLKYAERVFTIIGFFKENNYIENPKLSYGVFIEYKNGKIASEYNCELSSEQIKKVNKPEEIVYLFKKQSLITY